MSLSQIQSEFSFHISTILKLLSDDSGDSGIVQLIAEHPAIDGCSADERKIIGVAISKMIRRELFGNKWRKHHATAAIDDGDPITILRHIGRMYRIGYMKYLDPNVATILEFSDQYSERYIMFSFLNWAVQNCPLAKVKFSLPKKTGRIPYKDIVRNGKVKNGVDE